MIARIRWGCDNPQTKVQWYDKVMEVGPIDKMLHKHSWLSTCVSMIRKSSALGWRNDTSALPPLLLALT
jgi:hypothetical protein